jgi:hypothetical protein
VAPGVVTGFAGTLELGLEREVRPAGERAELATLGRFVLSFRPDVGLSRASGGDLAGKLMTCSRKGTE